MAESVIPPSAPNGSERDPETGRFVLGTPGRVLHGLDAERLPAEFEYLRAEVEVFMAASVADDGGEAEISVRRRALHEYRARIHRRVLQLDAALELRGLFDSKGKLRVAWLQRLESLVATARALDSLMGLERRQKRVDLAKAFAEHARG